MNSGIQPTVELATNNGNGFYPYPVYPMMGGGYGSGNGFFGGDGIWIIVLLALLFGWGGNGNGNGGYFGGRSFDDGYAWLSNGQKDIMTNTNNGFDTLHLSNQLEGARDGIYGLSNQLCNCCADMQQTVSNGFFNAEISANNRQMANMNTAFDLSRQFADCCCENRLGIAGLNATILSENCADRQALSEGVRDIIANQTASVQRILDQLCNDKIDAKNEKIADLQREILMKDLQASQVAQTADLRANNAVVANQLVSELRSCPIPAQPVYGNQPIFTCQPNYGCGCNNGYGTNII
jgi:hypothetical protein